MSGVLGTTPQAKKNKTFAGVEYRSPKKGEVFFNESTWHTAKSDYHATSHPVAIFEDTHREDGTPMEIAELPDRKGWRYEYIKAEDFASCYNDGDLWIYEGLGSWTGERDYSPSFNAGGHYALAYKIVQPTTREELDGGGQKITWLHWFSRKCVNETAAAQVLIKVGSNGLRVDDQSIEQLKAKEYRWSHSPTTALEDATEFEGGHNE